MHCIGELMEASATRSGFRNGFRTLCRARATAAQDKAKEIADAVRGGADLAKAAAAIGALVQLSPPLQRSGW